MVRNGGCGLVRPVRFSLFFEPLDASMFPLDGCLRSFRAFLGLAVVAFVFAGSGCVRSTVADHTVTFTNELWVPVVVFFGGIAGTLVGWFLRDVAPRYAWILMICGVVATIGLAPSIWLDRATIGPDSFSFRTGILGTNQAAARFDEVQSVRITTETGRRGRRLDYINFDLQNGDTLKRSLGNDVTREAAGLIVVECKSRNIPCAL